MLTIFDRLRQDGIDTSDSKELAETLGVDYSEATKKATRDTKDDVGDILEDTETTNTFPKPWMTPRDIKVMEGIKSRDEDKFNKLMEVLEYGDDYIQIKLPKSGILKIDREDLGEMPWQEGMDKAEELGKRLMAIEELTELPDFIGLEDCRDIFNFKEGMYCSSDRYELDNKNIYFISFDRCILHNTDKTLNFLIRCAHQ